MSCRTIVAATLLLAATPIFAAIRFNPDPQGVIEFPDTQLGDTATFSFQAICDSGETWSFRTLSHNDHFIPDRRERTVRSNAPVTITIRFIPGAAQDYDDTLFCIYYPPVGNNFRENWALRGRGTGEGQPVFVLGDMRTEFDGMADWWWEWWPGTYSDVSYGNDGTADLTVEISFDVEWLFVEYAQGVVVPHDGGYARIILSDSAYHLDPGFYEGNVTFHTNDPNQPDVIVPVTYDCPYYSHYCLPYGWRWIDDIQHWVTVESVVIEGQPAQQGDEIAVSSVMNGGWRDIAGYTVLGFDNDIALIERGQVWDDRFGMVEGDSLHFQVWDKSANREYMAYARYISGPSHFTHGGRTTVELSTEPIRETQAIPIPRGWSFISFRVNPDSAYWARQEGPDVRRLFAQLDSISIVKNGSGQFYLPAHDFSNIPYVSLEQGLMARNLAVDTLRMSGIPIPVDTPIHLHRGWNLVAYYPSVQLRMDVALRELVEAEQLVIAKDARGRFYLVNNDFGGWTTISPNSALQINVLNDCTFRYRLE